MSIAEQVEPMQERSTQVHGDNLAQLRQQGLHALVGVSAAVLLLAGYIVKRDFFDRTLPPPLPPTPVSDRYQLLQNDKKQTVRLDKTDGSIAVVEDGVIVSETRVSLGESVFRNYLEPKTYAWEKLNDGSKVTVKLEYHNGEAYRSIKVENISSALQQKLSQAKGLDVLYRVRFLSSGGTAIHEAVFLAGIGEWFWTRGTANGSLNLEKTNHGPCTATVFKSIETANIRFH
jgi:hypothetical protein